MRGNLQRASDPEEARSGFLANTGENVLAARFVGRYPLGVSMRSENGGMRPRRVLVVEDDDDSRDLLGELIATFGHNAIGARNAQDALHQVSTMPVDVALIDIGLPDM